jgi:pectinesterase
MGSRSMTVGSRPLWAIALLLLVPHSAARAADSGSTVAADGSGQFKTIQEAINAAPQTSTKAAPWAIHVRAGTYHELVYVQREKHFVRLVGDDPKTTIITYGLYASLPGLDGKPIGTFHTPTVWIDADDFSIENMTLANSAGRVGQALALRVDGDRVRFLNCRFLGWQDTILTNRGRHYFRDCYVEGAVDFIFGAATAYFDRCHITCVGDGYITAASTPAAEAFGFVFSRCQIDGASPGVHTYLGRPWRDYARVVFLNTQMTDVVRPVGWNNWSKPEREKTARYVEYGSTGSGANPGARAPWATTLTEAEAAGISPKTVLAGSDSWNPE